nr:MAG TPA: Exonuclease [Siphoviridae sp. ct5YG1]
MVWLLFGTAVHGVLEQHQETGTQFKEERIKVPFEEYVLSGKFDLYDAETKVVTDYKTASVWKIIFGDFSDWRRQTLIYCYMLRRIGFDAQGGEIVAFLKDHSKRDAKVKAGYPKFPVQTVKFHFTDDDFVECEDWLRARFTEIRAAEKLDDADLPVCTPDERFNSGDKYAVMKKGRKTALRVLDSQEAAEQWKADNGGDYIETRLGEDKKCADYCSACEFCNYYQERRAAQNGNGKEAN